MCAKRAGGGGKPSQKSVQKWTDRLNDRGTQGESALEELLEKPSRAPSVLIEVLKSGKRDATIMACRGLEALASEEQCGDWESKGALKKAAPFLASLVPDSEQPLCLAAVVALESTQSKSKAAVSALIRSLDDRRRHIRIAAALALGELKAEESVPDLSKLLGCRDDWVRRAAALALSRMGPQAGDAARQLGRMLSSKNPWVRAAAAKALAAMGEKARIVSSAIDKATKDSDGEVRAAALQAQGSFGECTDAGLDRLVLALDDKNFDVRFKASKRICKMGPKAKKAIPDLVRLLEKQEWPDNEPVSEALAAIGSAAVPSLRKIVQDESAPEDARRGAISALRDIEKPARSAIPDLIAALDSASQVVRREAAFALGFFGSDAEDAVPVLKDLVVSKTCSMKPDDYQEHDIFEHALQSLVMIRDKDSEMFSFVRSVYDKGVSIASAAAVHALRSFDVSDAEVAPLVDSLLEEALKSKDSRVAMKSKHAKDWIQILRR